MNRSKIYVICPDLVVSQYDKQKHYIDAKTLIKLYNVNPINSIVVPKDRTAWHPPKDKIYLWPRFNGDYSLKDEERI